MIYFVRHGESEANLKGVFAGQRDDSAITQKGREQAQETAKAIKLEIPKINRIISSPLKRAFETAEIIAQEVGIDVNNIEIDKRIAEYDMGSLTGTTYNHKIPSSILISAEHAEDTEEFKKRIVSCVKELSESQETILIVSHGLVAKMLQAVKQDIDTKLFCDLPHYSNASVTVIDWIK